MALHNIKKSIYSKQLKIFCFVFLVIIIFITYSNIFNYDFINFDDDQYVTENPVVQKGISLDNIKWAFGFSEEAIKFYWHPMTWLSHMADCQFFGLNPGFHHLSSLFFHCINSLLLFFIFYRMTGGLWQSAFIAALFAVHPLNVESVVWISERKNVLSTLFWMLTMLAYLHYARQPDLGRYLLVIFLFILGLLTKPMLVTLPCVFLLLDFWPLRRMAILSSEDSLPALKDLIPYPQMPLKKLLLEKLPLLTLSFLTVGISVLSIHITQQIVPGDTVPLTLRIENALVSYVKYIGKLIWPRDMAVFYPFPDTIPLWQPIAAGMLLAGISIAAIILIKKAPWLLIGWLWYLGTLFPVIGISQHARWPEMADRWVYIPEIGIFVMVVWSGSAITAKLPHRRVFLSLITVTAITVFAMISRNQISYWKNSITLFAHTLEATQNNPTAHFNLGSALAKEGDTDQAIYHYNQSLALKENAEVHNNLGNALARKGQIDQAISHYYSALKLDSDYNDAHSNLGNAFAEKKLTEKAIYHYTQALIQAPENTVTRMNLGQTLLKSGRLDDAEHQFKQILQLESVNASAYNGLGVLYSRQKKTEQAINCFKKALAIDPESVNARQNLEQIIALKQKIKSSTDKILNQLTVDPKNPVLHYQLGNLYLGQGLFDSAIDAYQNAIDLNPEFTDGLYNLGIAYFAKEEYDNAILSFEKILHYNPNNPKVLYNLACIYSAKNSRTESVKWLERAVIHGFDNWEKLKSDPDLENIRKTLYFQSLIQGQ